MSQFFTSGGQSIGVSASTSVLPMNIQRTDFLYDGLIGSPCSPRDSQESSPTPQFKSINSSVLSFIVQHLHPYMTTGKTIPLTRRTFVGKVMSLLFNMLSNGGAWWAAVYGVAQSRTRLKRLSSSSSSRLVIAVFLGASVF